jgi:hypothetical protein
VCSETAFALAVPIVGRLPQEPSLASGVAVQGELAMRSSACHSACQACSKSARHLLLRELLPLLTIVLLLLTAGALLLAAALLVVPPLPAASACVGPVAVTEAPQTDVTRSSLARIAQVALPRTPAVVDLARLVYAPGAGGSHHGLPGPSLLVLDAGSLSVQLDGAAHLLQAEQPRPVAAGDLVLQPGDGLLLPRGTAATFHNGGSVPAVVLAAGIVPSGGGASRFGRVGVASWAEAWSPGATVQPLAGGWIGTTTASSATLTVQRLTVPADARLPLSAPGPVDLAVETGVLTLEARGGLVWHQPRKGRIRPSHRCRQLPCCRATPSCCRMRPPSPCATMAAGRWSSSLCRWNSTVTGQPHPNPQRLSSPPQSRVQNSQGATAPPRPTARQAHP